MNERCTKDLPAKFFPGFVYSDLKPENVVVRGQGESWHVIVKLLWCEYGWYVVYVIMPESAEFSRL